MSGLEKHEGFVQVDDKSVTYSTRGLTKEEATVIAEAIKLVLGHKQ